MRLLCHHCQHTWNYKGTSRYYACCPTCHYKTRVDPIIDKFAEKFKKDKTAQKVFSKELIMCLACKKLFHELVKHHVSYKHNFTVNVCQRCHGIIHQTYKYSLLKPIDKLNGKSWADLEVTK